MLALRGVTNKYAFHHGAPAENNPPPRASLLFVCVHTDILVPLLHADRAPDRGDAQAGGGGGRVRDVAVEV